MPLALGNFATLPFVMALTGLLISIVLVARRVRGALLFGILLTTLLATAIRSITGLQVSAVPTAATLPSQFVALPDFSTLGAGLNLEVFVKLSILAAVLTIFSVMLSDFFDTMGTVIGVGAEAGWLDSQGRLPRLNRVLLVDSLAPFGAPPGPLPPPPTSRARRASRKAPKTGLAAVCTGLLFLVCIFFAPVAGMIPPEATSAALILVGVYTAAHRPRDRLQRRGGGAAGPPDYGGDASELLHHQRHRGRSSCPSWWSSWPVARPPIHLMMWVAALAFLLYFALPALQSTFGF